MWIKVCGITKISNALEIINCGVNALGFIMIQQSRRYITGNQAAAIINELPIETETVLVIANEPLNYINKLLQTSRFSYVQCHGNESLDYIRNINAPVIKTIKITDSWPRNEIENYINDVHAVLLETYHPQQLGGTGSSFNWELLSNNDLAKIIIAGGISPDNIATLRPYQPMGIDINSGVETNPGIKSIEKVRKLLEHLRN